MPSGWLVGVIPTYLPACLAARVPLCLRAGGSRTLASHLVSEAKDFLVGLAVDKFSFGHRQENFFSPSSFSLPVLADSIDTQGGAEVREISTVLGSSDTLSHVAFLAFAPETPMFVDKYY